MGVVEDLASAKEAFEQREWAAAYERLSGADTAGGLEPADLARWATAAYLLGRNDDALRALQRAHTEYLADGDVASAVRCAFWAGMVLALRGEQAVAGGWFARGWRLVEGLPEPCAERGYLLMPQIIQQAMAADFHGAASTAEDIERIGKACGDMDLVVAGMHHRGRAMLYTGQVQEGLALMDEAMVGVSAGEVSPVFAGMFYCSHIEACQELSEFSRAREWTTALTRWCGTQPDLVPYTGQCAVHRGQLLRVEGALSEALQELALAMERYERAGEAYPAGLALYERGEVYRWMGELDHAEAAFREASARGYDPQPGLALLWVAQGRTEAAVAAVTRLANETHDVVHRARVLPAVVELHLAAGDVEAARAATHDLSEVAATTRCAATRARAATARGAVALATEESGAGLADLRAAVRVWSDMGAPLEAARARVWVARALRSLGDHASADLEAGAAARVFRSRGAAGALAEAEGVLDHPTTVDGALPKGLTAREGEVLRLVARGMSTPGIARDLYLSEKTVARHLSNIFAKLDVSSRTAAAAFAFENDLV